MGNFFFIYAESFAAKIPKSIQELQESIKNVVAARGTPR